MRTRITLRLFTLIASSVKKFMKPATNANWENNSFCRAILIFHYTSTRMVCWTSSIPLLSLVPGLKGGKLVVGHNVVVSQINVFVEQKCCVAI
jgi:hypothetical protein